MFAQADKRLRAFLEPRRFVRWIYVGRLSVASAIFIAAIYHWVDAEHSRTLVASLCLVGALLTTGASLFWTEANGRRLTEGFLFGQLVVDLIIITGVVHVTSSHDAGSQFAALYILVNASAALLLPIRGALLIALLGMVLYVGDAIAVSGFSNATLFQLAVFSSVAVGTGYISARLHEAGKGREQLAAELVSVRLREKDILANIKSGIVSVDDNGALIFANPAAAELLGLDLDSRLARPVVEDIRAVAPELGDALERAIRERVHATRGEGLIIRDGRVFPFGVTTTSSEGDGRLVGRTTTAIFQDISDNKRLERLNLRAQRLEAVAELSASLAHEIKNPLASIRSAVEQMSARPAATADERTLGNLIVRESDRLSRLLSEFLDFARVRVTRREPVDVSTVVRGAVALAAQHPSYAEKSSVRLDADVPATPLFVYGDEDLLHRAVFNLVLNALQATPPGTTVRLVASLATNDQLPKGTFFDGGAVALQVLDEGPGIPRQVQDRLFEPFTTTKTGGSGLGLAIAHRAIEAHRGVILVDTDERGTRFIVLLPRADTNDGASP
ncbi:MAG TPA: ATP-binding protein [Gemmatimonadaceae bacterium]|nr:ATP-binding protein [Gemmatimonadaceae bacterium]